MQHIHNIAKLWDTKKVVLRGMFTAVSDNIKKKTKQNLETSHTSNLTTHLKALA